MKKKLFRYIILLIVGVVISGFAGNISENEKINAYFSDFIFASDFDESNKPYSEYYFNTLSDIEKQAYICIFNNISSHPEYIKIPGLTSEEFNNVYFAVKNDNPDMLCFNDFCTMSEFLNICLVQPDYEYDSSQCDNMQTELMQEVQFIINEMPDFNDDYSKELYIHDYIVENCDYKEDKYSSSAYGCLIDGFAVCSGYSRAAMLLLNEAGINSVVIAGTGKSATSGTVSHMWNIVRIDDEAYHLDVTWDDPVIADDGMISHMYFNLSDEAIKIDHSEFSTSFDCVSNKYNYFIFNDLYFDSYDKDSLATIKLRLANNINNGKNYVEFSFGNNSSYQKACERLSDNYTEYSDIYELLDYISKHASDKVDITHINYACDESKKYIRMMFDII